MELTNNGVNQPGQDVCTQTTRKITNPFYNQHVYSSANLILFVKQKLNRIINSILFYNFSLMNPISSILSHIHHP